MASTVTLHPVCKELVSIFSSPSTVPKLKMRGKKIKVQVSSYFSSVVQILMLCHQVCEGEVQ